MQPTRLYTPQGSAALLSDVGRMMKEAELLKMAFVAPTVAQRADVLHATIQLIRARRRKIYGGHALNACLLEGGHAPIYGEGSDPAPDIEFYSPEPIKDMRELCDRLYAAGHNHVQGREAMHHGTFTVSVEFTRVCDISYVPPKAFEAIPFRSVPVSTILQQKTTGPSAPSDSVVDVVEPSFALIDHLRILCDPFTSHWKLDRQLARMMTIQRLFPLDLPAPNPFKRDARRPLASVAASEALASASAWASGRSSVASVADHALGFYLSTRDSDASEQRGTTTRPPIRLLSLVSVNYEEDLVALAETLDVLGATVVEHYPFIDLLGRRAVFRVDGAPVVSLFDARGKAVPVVARSPVDGILVTSVSYAIMVSLAIRFLAVTDKNDSMALVHGGIVSNLIHLRSTLSCGLPMSGSESSDPGTDDAARLLLDARSVFRDTRLSYIGVPRTDMSIHMEMADERRLRSTGNFQAWMTYDPKRPGKGPKTKTGPAPALPSYLIFRCDGHAITSAKDSVLAARKVLAEMRPSLALPPPPPCPISLARSVPVPVVEIDAVE